VVWCVCGNGASITRGRCLQARRDAILPTRKIFCPFDFFRTAKQSRFPTENASRQTCQPGRQNRASPRKTVSRDFQVARRIDPRRAKSFFFGLISSGSRASGFSLSNARFRETGDR